jgi:hypothetical protein
MWSEEPRFRRINIACDASDVLYAKMVLERYGELVVHVEHDGMVLHVDLDPSKLKGTDREDIDCRVEVIARALQRVVSLHKSPTVPPKGEK